MTMQTVICVAADSDHRFFKQPQPSIRLIAGLGVGGDAHAGRTIRHRSRVAKDPGAPNLRQVHLLQAELLEELAAKGFAVRPAQLGENLTTRGIDLLHLSRGTRLRIGAEAVLEVTGLRNPCWQINHHIGAGAMEAALERAADGSLIRKAGIMAIVLASGEVRAGDPIRLEWEPPAFVPLAPV